MNSNNNLAPSGLASGWIAAVNIDLSAALAVSRASAKAIADLSPEADKRLRRRLEEEAATLDSRGGLESSTAAMLVRRTLEPVG